VYLTLSINREIVHHKRGNRKALGMVMIDGRHTERCKS